MDFNGFMYQAAKRYVKFPDTANNCTNTYLILLHLEDYRLLTEERIKEIKIKKLCFQFEHTNFIRRREDKEKPCTYRIFNDILTIDSRKDSWISAVEKQVWRGENRKIGKHEWIMSLCLGVQNAT